jgi:hypothetical protein
VANGSICPSATKTNITCTQNLPGYCDTAWTWFTSHVPQPYYFGNYGFNGRLYLRDSIAQTERSDVIVADFAAANFNQESAIQLICKIHEECHPVGHDGLLYELSQLELLCRTLWK